MSHDPSSAQRLARALATTGGLGDRLPAPGTTAGSAPAALAWWLAGWLTPVADARITGIVIASVIATGVGWWAAGVEARRRGASDPGPVVIDEVAGQWLCFAVMCAIAGSAAASAWPGVALGFVVFRVLDVWKPWPVRPLERLPGGLGIMADDVAAGALAGAIVGAMLRLVGG
jgi:phosphatidylglycerophosphatase A